MRALVAALALLASYAHGQTLVLPTDVDLKTTYCLKIKQAQSQYINALARNEPTSSGAYEMLQKTARDHNADVDRLRSYLLPRVSALDTTPLEAASNRAEADIRELSAMSNVCTPRCQQHIVNHIPTSQWTICLDNCRKDYPAAVRVDACKVVNWLPF